jgi:acyl-CoA dehydrogenase
MSESLSMLSETADRLFANLAARREEGFAALWPAVEEVGFPLLLVPEAEGGFGGDWQDAFAVARLAGFHALPLPVADAILGAAVAADAGWPTPEGLAVHASGCEGKVSNGRFTGRLTGVPFGRHAATIFATLNGKLLRLTPANATPRENTAAEPRDVLDYADAPVEEAAASLALEYAALLRTAQIAGALDAALGMSIAHVNDRVQFGKPIAKFQAVQQSLAVFAEEAAAVNCAGQAAARAADRGDAGFEIAAAKLRANMASGIGAATAHQVHGAIGFTQECGLHHFTRRLAAWRTEAGGDRFWAQRLGEQVCARGAENFWPDLVRRSDAA